jgi:hypothetical protein
MKFRSWEQKKRTQEHWQKKAQVGNIRRQEMLEANQDYTQMMASNGADTLGPRTKDHGVTRRYLRHV